MPADQLDSLPI
jgi:hypothetical protein